EDLFPSQKDWDAAFEELKQLKNKAAEFEGKLSTPDNVNAVFALEDDLSLRIERLYVYAHLSHDQDTTNPTYQALVQKAKKLSVEVSEALSFITPEILALPEEQLDSYISDPQLADYKFTL